MRLNSILRDLLVLVWLLLLPGQAEAQGTFVNLGFEDARIVPITSDLIAITNALPGWQIDQLLAAYHTRSLGAATVYIYDQGSERQPLYGNFSVGLQSSFSGQFAPSIWQTGTIPNDAHSLLLMTDSTSADLLSTTFGGQQLSLVRVGARAGRTTYGERMLPGLLGKPEFSSSLARPHSISSTSRLLKSRSLAQFRSCCWEESLFTFFEKAANDENETEFRAAVLIVFVGLALLPKQTGAQGSFQNPGFEAAKIVEVGPYQVHASMALPGWIASINDVPLTSLLYHTVTLGGADVAIRDRNSIWQPFLGNYSIDLIPSLDRRYIPSISQPELFQKTRVRYSF